MVNTSSFGTTVPSIPLGTYSITITALNAANQPLGPPSTPVNVQVQ